MFDKQIISGGGACTDKYCPVSPRELEELDRLFGQDDELPFSDEDCLSVSDAIVKTEIEVFQFQLGSNTDTRASACLASTEPPQALPKTIPLCIALGAHLTDPAEKACAEAVAGHLSNECDRVVGVDDLEGLLLFLWSEHDIEGIPISDYLNESRPLQGLVIHPRDSLSQVGEELRGMLGKSFEFVAV
jgi:hypothetical protein